MPTEPPVAADRAARRGPVPLHPEDKRGHCVSVRLNSRELALLDGKRGQFQRGEWLRIAALDQLPPTVPELNVRAWSELARLAVNLNQAQASINRGDCDNHHVELLDYLRDAVATLRRELVGVQT